MQRARQLILFGLVGAIAAAIHLFTVSQLVPLGMHPLAANVFGFATAFGISFTGHSILTFPSTERSHLPSLRRFLAVASLAFASNEILYGLLLQYSDLDYRIALLLVLIVISTATFLGSKFWAFRID